MVGYRDIVVPVLKNIVQAPSHQNLSIQIKSEPENAPEIETASIWLQKQWDFDTQTVLKRFCCKIHGIAIFINILMRDLQILHQNTSGTRGKPTQPENQSKFSCNRHGITTEGENQRLPPGMSPKLEIRGS